MRAPFSLLLIGVLLLNSPAFAKVSCESLWLPAKTTFSFSSITNGYRLLRYRSSSPLETQFFKALDSWAESSPALRNRITKSWHTIPSGLKLALRRAAEDYLENPTSHSHLKRLLSLTVEAQIYKLELPVNMRPKNSENITAETLIELILEKGITHVASKLSGESAVAIQPKLSKVLSNIPFVARMPLYATINVPFSFFFTVPVWVPRYHQTKLKGASNSELDTMINTGVKDQWDSIVKQNAMTAKAEKLSGTLKKVHAAALLGVVGLWLSQELLGVDDEQKVSIPTPYGLISSIYPQWTQESIHRPYELLITDRGLLEALVVSHSADRVQEITGKPVSESQMENFLDGVKSMTLEDLNQKILLLQPGVPVTLNR
jgi:hypothetical protein